MVGWNKRQLWSSRISERWIFWWTPVIFHVFYTEIHSKPMAPAKPMRQNETCVTFHTIKKIFQTNKANKEGQKSIACHSNWDWQLNPLLQLFSADNQKHPTQLLCLANSIQKLFLSAFLLVRFVSISAQEYPAKLSNNRFTIICQRSEIQFVTFLAPKFEVTNNNLWVRVTKKKHPKRGHKQQHWDANELLTILSRTSIFVDSKTKEQQLHRDDISSFCSC